MANSGTNDNCYTDQPSSLACDEPNSVPCTDLSPETEKACCPPLTSCADSKQGSEVRCQIAYPNLMAVAGGGTKASSSATQSSSSSSSAATTTTTSFSATKTASATPMGNTGDSEPAPATAREQPGQAMKGGAIAGVAVGIVLFLLLAGALIRYFTRRRRRRDTKNEATPSVRND